MKKIDWLFASIIVLNAAFIFFLFMCRSLDDSVNPQKVAETGVSAVTFKPEKKIPIVESEVSRKLREAGLDGGFATVDTSLEEN